MLIYNFEKKFIGIDADDLKIFGFANLKDLQSYCSDIADLFVKTPGYLHNFNDIHWIDYILNSKEEYKVIIKLKESSLTSNVNVKIAYFSDAPKEPAYLIQFSNLRNLNDAEIQNNSLDIQNKPVIIPEAAPQEKKFEPIIEVTQQNLKPEVKIKLDEQIEPADEYIYNPEIASKKLGLSVDLIKEFIEDFINQAKEFKPRLSSALQNEDLQNTHKLVHKLKGVAANLMIENAHEALVKANESQDMNIIKTNIDKFYKIMDNLTHYEHQPQQNVTEHVQETPLEEPQTVEEKPISLEPIELDIYSDDGKTNEKKHPKNSNDSTYDKNEAAKAIGLDTQSFNELFNDFLNEANAQIAKISHDIQDQDTESLHSHVKNFKSMSENMRFHSLTTQLEMLLVDEKNFSKAKDVLTNITKIIESSTKQDN